MVKMAWAGLDCFETAAQTGYSTDKEKEATKLHNLPEVTPLLVELLEKKKKNLVFLSSAIHCSNILPLVICSVLK